MRNPLPTVALLYAGGLLLARFFPGPLTWLFALSFGLGLLALVCSSYRRLILVLFLPLVGATNLVTRTAVVSPNDLRLLLTAAPEVVTVRAVLTETPTLRESQRADKLSQRSVVELDVCALARGGAGQTPAFGRIVASTPGVLDASFFCGREIEVTGVLQAPAPPAAPGQFDYRTHLQWRGVHYQLKTQATNDWQIAPAPADKSSLTPPRSDQFSQWAQRTLALGLAGEDESLRLLWAMTLGWKTALTQEVAEPFMQSGTLHIFAISGLHIALISGILISLLRVLRVPRAASGLVVIPLIWFYTVATGWQASAIRSTIMMTVVIAGWALARPSHLINSLAAAGLIILMWDPTQLFQAGFQLSFFVVLGIALLVPPLEVLRERILRPDPLLPPELRPRWQRWLDSPLRVVTSSLATSMAAWIGSMPLIAHYFYMITPVSLLANLLIVPLSSIALMSSLGSLICGDWCPFLTVLFNHSSWLWMRLMIGLSQWFASLPGGFLYVPRPGLFDFTAYYLLVGLVLSGSFLVPGRRLWAGLGAGLIASVWALHMMADRDQIRITVLPVPAGVIFIDAPGRANDLLIDAGDAGAAERMVTPFLHSQGVNRLESLLLTHGDLRHEGGTEFIGERFHLANIVTSTAPSRSPADRHLRAQLARTPERWRQSARGDAICSWRLLHPDPVDHFTQADNSAVVLAGQFYGTRVILLSDVGRLGQRALFDREPGLRSDILVLGISGQSQSFPAALIDAIKPLLLIVACAEYPSSARPTAAFRKSIAERQIPVIYTSEAGAATLTLRPLGWDARVRAGVVGRGQAGGGLPEMGLATGPNLRSKHRMPDWLGIICLGIIEGVTEFLPISSTGHLLLAEHWLPRQSDLFNTLIQCGTVLAVVIVFTGRLKQLAFRWREPDSREYLLKLAVAFIITGVGGLVLKKLHFKLPETVTPVASATLIGGVFFVVVEQWLRNKQLRDEITWRVACAVGTAQLLAAVFPGTSRSGVTILAALVLGAGRPAATEFSFLLGIPTLLAAGALQTVTAFRHHETASMNWPMLLLGSVVAAVVAFGVVRWLLRFVQTHTFAGFGWYRIILGILMLMLVKG